MSNLKSYINMVAGFAGLISDVNIPLNYKPSNHYTYKRDKEKIGRNKPCPCGSGKKFKKCCGKIKE